MKLPAVIHFFFFFFFFHCVGPGLGAEIDYGLLNLNQHQKKRTPYILINHPPEGYH